MFSQACIIPSVDRGSVCAEGEGHAWQRGGVHFKGVACMTKCMCGRGHVWWGACVAGVMGMHGKGGMHGREHAREGHVRQGACVVGCVW